MLDKRLPYHSILMRCDAASVSTIDAPALPEGFSYRLYQPGDMDAWARIETQVLEFPSEADARRHFEEHFLPAEEELTRRLYFIVSPDGIPCATANAWYGTCGGRRVGMLHWVAVSPRVQGMGLGYAAVARAMSAYPVLEPGLPVYLHTQTWSYQAVGIYLRLGFYPLREEVFNGYENGFEAAALAIAPYMRKPLYDQFLRAAR